MKAFKLTKSMMQDPQTLLEKVGAINSRTKEAYPQYVYIGAKDYKKLNQNVRKAFKNKYSYLKNLKKESLDFDIGLHMLNLAPVEIDKGIEKGYVIVDTASIFEEKQRSNGN